SFFNIFPLRGLTSDYWSQLSIPGKILDYFWHLVLPIISMGLAAFATMTLLTKNSFLDEIRKQYVLTARAKGCAERQVLSGHVFRNAMLIVIAGFPGAFVHAFFAGSLLIETIFSLDGIGLLGFESVLNRDYAVVFATLYIMSLVGLVVNLLSDLTYTWVDRPIDFATRGGGGGGADPRRAPPHAGPGDDGADADGARRAAGAASLGALGAQPPALAEFQGEPARLLGVLDIYGFVRRVAVCRVHRQRQA